MTDGMPFDNLRSETQHENAMRMRAIWEQHDRLRDEATDHPLTITEVRISELEPGERVELHIGAPEGPSVEYRDAPEGDAA